MKLRLVTAVATVGLLVSATVSAFGSPASADSLRCLSWETAYGISRAGGLEAHAYCVEGDAAGRQASRQAAPAGWWQGGTVFASGTVELGGGHPAVAIYQVAPDGTLLWYGDDGEHALGTGAPVGTQFGDWRRFRTLFSEGGGSIFGVDSAGQVEARWHWGYPGADESWTAPWAVASGFSGRQVLAGRDGSSTNLFGTDPASPRSVTIWSDAARVAARQPIVGGPAPSAPSWVDAKRGYGRSPDGRIVRLTQSGVGGGVRWVAEPLTAGGFVRVFAGGVVHLVAVSPYEWQ